MFKVFKNFLPQSLFPRLILMIIIPTLIANLLTAYIFYQRHLSNVNNNLMNSLTDSIITIVKIYESNIPDKSEVITQLSSNLRLFVSINEKGSEKFFPKSFSKETQSLKEKIEERLHYKANVYYTNKKKEISTVIESQDSLIKIIASRRRIYINTTNIFIMWLIGAAVLFAAMSIIFVKNQVTPIKRLSKAVEQFGKGQSIDGLRLEGAKEIRKAALAFTRMKSRIERYLAQRTEMLAGVSHDLRTPITRIKLQLEMMPPSKDILSIKQDLLEMENMIQAYLDFAKGEDNEISVKVYLNEYLLSIVKLYRKSDKSIVLDSSKTKKSQIDLKLTSFKRALSNIIDNAIRYSTKIKISTNRSEEYLLIMIEDNGPGIEKKFYEEAFKPFSRLDLSRNANSSGAGLGLSIARDIINHHGGQITLDRSSELKGLKVIIKLPY